MASGIRSVPASLSEVDPAYVLQLALYRRLLMDMQPGASVRATLVYTAAERHALISADEERQREKDRLERAPAVADLGASIDDAVLPDPDRPRHYWAMYPPSMTSSEPVTRTAARSPPLRPRVSASRPE